MNVWETVKSWMGNDIFSIFVYIAILALFVTGIVKCIIPVVRTRDLLRRAVKNIKMGDKARRSWQDDRFLGRGVLMPHWSEYLNNLFFADNEYHNPANVEDYINEETVIDGPGRAQLAEALPGVQVSLGFLGTLMGLSLALSGMGADVSDVSGSMSTLLSSMRYAFLTSIVGVVSSVTFTLITRAVHGSAQRTLLSFYNAMARYAGVLSVDPMTQIAIYQQEQTGLMKQLLEVSSAEKLAEKLDETLTPLTQAVRDCMNLVAMEQKKLMNDVAEAYIRRMDEAVHGQFDHLAATIEETCRYQEKTVRSVSDALGSFGEAARAMREVRQHSVEILDKYENALARISQAQGRNEDAAERTEKVVAAQSEYMSMLAGLNEEFSRQVNAIQEATNAFIAANEAHSRESAACAEQTVRRLGEAGQALSGTMTEARKKLTRDMNESLDYFESLMTEVLKNIEWAASSVKDSVAALPEAVKTGCEQYTREIETITETLRASRKKLASLERDRKTEGSDESK